MLNPDIHISIHISAEVVKTVCFAIVTLAWVYVIGKYWNGKDKDKE